MYRLIFLLTIGLPLWATAQDTRRVTEKHKEPPYTEEYHVLRSDGVTREGEYERYLSSSFGAKRMVTDKGSYHNGLKEGTWYEYVGYDAQGYHDPLAATGNYTAGQKSGVWVYYRNADTVEQRFNYDTRQPEYLLQDPTKKCLMLQGSDTVNTVMDRGPVCVGGSALINHVIAEEIYYPELARERSLQGKVVVAFTIDTAGRASAPWIKKSVDPVLDNEALRVTGHINTLWLPGVVHGQKVPSIYVIPVSFILE
jgi:TonB family protein